MILNYYKILLRTIIDIFIQLSSKILILAVIRIMCQCRKKIRRGILLMFLMLRKKRYTKNIMIFFIDTKIFKEHNMVVYGDMGTTNDMCFEAIKNYVQKNKVDLLWHVGDFCYNMDEMDG